MIKVLQVLPGLDRGGLETFVMNIYRTIDRSIIQFDFLTNMEKGDYAEEIKSLGGNIYYIPPRNQGYGQYIKYLSEFFMVHGNEYSAIHYHESSLTSIEVLYYAKRAKIPVRIMHSHSSSIIGSKLHYILHYIGKIFIKSLATHYFGCSDKAIKWMYSSTGAYNKAKIINNGINISDYTFNISTRTDVRKKLNLSDKIVIGHVGRFMAVKNHKFLLDIFEELYKINPKYHLLLIGTGELKSEISKRVRVLGLVDNVSFLGVRIDISTLMMAMDIFVMPSLYEGLPVTLVEAQASGLPIVCSDTISLMSKITPFYYTCNLNDRIEKWCIQIESALKKSFDRTKNADSVRDAGFDIQTTAIYLENIYQGKV